MAPKIAIVYYSMYGHVKTLAEAELKGIREAGGDATLFQVPETLSDEVLQKMHAPPKPTDVAVLNDPAELEAFDGVLFGIPTRYGNFPAQFKTFWDKTGKQWSQGSYFGIYAGMFISTGTMGGGQESTAIAAMSTLTHHGFIYVPLGYKNAFAQLSNLDEIHGGSPWGAGTFSGADGSRQPTALELSIATEQGKAFYAAVAKAHPTTPNTTATTQNQTQNGTSNAIKETPAAAPTTQRVPEQPTGPQEKKKDSEGPCGLPSKCDIM